MAAAEWEAAFLKALGETGVASAAAEVAGIGVRNAFKRRKACPTFAAAWAASTELYRTEQARRALGAAEALVASRRAGGKAVRRGQSKWSKRREESFLGELAATASVQRAAAAAGFTASALYYRRRVDKRFGELWDEAIAVGRSRIEGYLLEAADRSFAPDQVDPDNLPKMTTAEAIQVMKITNQARAAARQAMADAPEMEEAEANDLRQRLIEQLDRLREREDKRRAAEGWSRYGEVWIPPGWGPVGEAAAPGPGTLGDGDGDGEGAAAGPEPEAEADSGPRVVQL